MRRRKYIYFFGGPKTEGRKELTNLLGGKGANLAEMARLGIPVPPGFTITTDVCTYYYDHEGNYPRGFKQDFEKHIARVEKTMQAGFGDSENPLLVSVRSGARISMPGMMDTILNLGLNDKSVRGLINKTGNERFVYDSYRRFIQMYANVVMRVEYHEFENILHKKKKILGIEEDSQLDPRALQDIIRLYKARVKKLTKKEVPQDPEEQLWGAVGAVFASWNNDRAVSYREIHKIPHGWGTAVNVQTMVFGNMGASSGTGVCFSRNPSTGENIFYGDFLINAQGEDVVSGIRTPGSITKKRGKEKGKGSLEELMPRLYKRLHSTVARLERHYKDLQDVEFTIQKGELWILQTRSGKRTPEASVKIAVDMVREKLISRREALLRLDPYQVEKLLHPTFNVGSERQVLAKGLPASPGAAVGRVVFTPERAEELASEEEKVILVRIMTSPEDIRGMNSAEGILTQVGGLTSHAALVSRGMGKCCVVGCSAVEVNYQKKEFRAGNVRVREGDTISLDGSTGEVMLGELELTPPQISKEFYSVLEWADEERVLGVRTNADTPKQARLARDFGAEGVGLARTEHMFFEEDRIDDFRAMILAEDEKKRMTWLERIYRLQKQDFTDIFKEMEGKEVTIRLLDPPLHEFLPEDAKDRNRLAKKLRLTPSKVKEKIHSTEEQNPMLGHRGVRLGITHPEIYDMQARAILEAAVVLLKKRKKIFPEIMLPLVATLEEFEFIHERIVKLARDIQKRHRIKIPYKIGTMIEIPRAALIADQLASTSQFFSFGTNDLTQTTFGISRDDIGSFLPAYTEHFIFKDDPFSTIDEQGVGELIKIAVAKARKVRPNIKIGICGEHGGDPKTIEFCHKVGLDYVSASPFRVPIARLAAAQAAIRENSKEI